MKIIKCVYISRTIQIFISNSFYDEDFDSIIFSAETVITLKEYLSDICNYKMSYNTCIKMIDDLTKQIIYLKKNGYGFYGFNLNDILVIDDIFVFCCSDFLLPLIKDNCILLEYGFLYVSIKVHFWFYFSTFSSEIQSLCS